MRSVVLCAAMLGLLLAPLKSFAAPTVTYTLQINASGPGTWSLFGETSAGDNAGLSLWQAQLVNISSPGTIQAPYLDYTLGGSHTIGLHDLETAANPFGSAQDTFGGELPVYYLGQQAGTLTAPGGGTPGASRNPTYAAMLLLASGTWNVGPNLPAFDTNQSFASVFVNDTGTTEVQVANFNHVVSVVPEPVAGALLAISSFAMALSRPRRNA